MKILITVCFGCCLVVLCCRGKVKGSVKDTTTNVQAGYTFQTPDASWDLPGVLNEISGIGLVNDSIMVCQEDENGLLYLFNLSTNHIDKTISFGKPNDYEDLAIVGPDIFVLQSNGNIVQVADYLETPVITRFKTALTGKNDTEGLCYDPGTNALLLSCKAKQDDAEETQAKKIIYAFGLQEKIILAKPMLTFDEPEFAPSALAVHPVSHHIFVLSSKKKRLIELSRDGMPLNRYDLKGNFFIQPEGLTILANGDLYISNEGKGGSANILLFKFKR